MAIQCFRLIRFRVHKKRNFKTIIMEAIYLQSMTDFVLGQRMTTEEVNASSFYDIQTHIYKYYDKVFNYANFLKQPLQLGFFVPYDENGNVLEEPQMRPEMNSFDEEDVDYDAQELYEYIEAKKRVLFKGFELYNDENTIRYNNIFIENQDFKKGLTIESLKSYCSTTSIELTDSAIEQIGLKN